MQEFVVCKMSESTLNCFCFISVVLQMGQCSAEEKQEGLCWSPFKQGNIHLALLLEVIMNLFSSEERKAQ